MTIFEEELLEPIIRPIRFKKGLVNIGNKKPVVLADLGCGPKIRFYNYATKNNIRFSKYIGIDPRLTATTIQKYKEKKKNILLIKAPMNKKIPLKNNSVDYVTGFAFIEHIVNPSEIVNDSVRILKPGGMAIFTTPTPTAKYVLEFLSYKLGIISKREIKEHKNYFNKKSLENILVKNKHRIKSRHEYFELGFNNLFVVKKLK
jgi:ubiquinone/menaquinone biosynthesis C-methylase UbiE